MPVGTCCLSIVDTARTGGLPSRPLRPLVGGSRPTRVETIADVDFSEMKHPSCHEARTSETTDIRHIRASIIPPTKRRRRESLPVGVSDMCRATWTFEQSGRRKEKVELVTPLEVIFFPKWSNGAAGILGSRPLERHLIHYWEVTFVDRVFGTSMQVGLATKHASLYMDRFRNLFGSDEHSWAFSHTGKLRHANEETTFCKPLTENETVTIGLMFNGPRGTLSLWKNGKSLGEAFRGLDLEDEDLYPAFGSTAARTTMRITARWRSFENLQDRCRVALRKKYPTALSLSNLPIPVNLRFYIMSCYEADADPIMSKVRKSERDGPLDLRINRSCNQNLCTSCFTKVNVH